MNSSFESAKCVGRWHLFDSVHPADHAIAKKLCGGCPTRDACRELLHRELDTARTMRAAGGGPSGTWSGRLITKGVVA